eukprot:TRINITY_DN619_c0_g1_i1.p2 TRINITY_DN619_c0_g1~~TRINITY_DN619_c0_g1_i1.p2  ORF type:complete len:110 (-),score=1.61 TRINITY_DN619_c0_g1_i1:85-414(-)
MLAHVGIPLNPTVCMPPKGTSAFDIGLQPNQAIVMFGDRKSKAIGVGVTLVSALVFSNSLIIAVCGVSTAYHSALPRAKIDIIVNHGLGAPLNWNCVLLDAALVFNTRT